MKSKLALYLGYALVTFVTVGLIVGLVWARLAAYDYDPRCLIADCRIAK